MTPLDSSAIASLQLERTERVIGSLERHDGSLLVLTSRRFVVLVPRGWINIEYDRTATFDLGLGINESIVNSWLSAPNFPIVLTSQRLLVLTTDAGRIGNLLSRNLETIAEPTIEVWKSADGRESGYSLHVAGRTIAFYDSSVHAAKDDIAHTRARRLQQVAGGPGSDAGLNRPEPVQREREVIREIVRTPCSHCGLLVDNTALRCPSCGAPR